jgi:penicillin-binding protein 2
MDISDLIKTNSIYLKSKKLLGKSFSFIENLNLKKKDQLFSTSANSTAKIYFIVILIITIGYIYKIVQLQIGDYEKFKNLSAKNYLRTELIAPNRGLILDREGEYLVKNIPKYVLNQNLSKCLLIKENNFIECRKELNELRNFIEFDEKEIQKNYSEKNTLINIKKEVTKDEAIKIGSLKNLKSIEVTIVPLREYQYPKSMSHLLGYVGLSTTQYGVYEGKQGIEDFYNGVLSGVSGQVTYKSDSLNNKLDSYSEISPISGKDIKLTVSAKLQNYAFQLLEEKINKSDSIKGGVVVVENPKTGEILTLVNYPTFDLNQMSRGISEKDYQELLSKNNFPFLNRSISGNYAPGSIFKLVTGSGILEQGIAKPRDEIFDKGFIKIGDYTFNNWKLDGHGIVDITRAMKVSNDTYFYIYSGGFEGRKGLGIQGIYDWSKKYNFGEKTGIDLNGELSGYVPNGKNKIWYLGDTYITAIGQGDVLASPVQISVLMSYFANNQSAMVPHIISEISNYKKVDKVLYQNLLSSDNYTVLKNSLKEVNSIGGTGYPFFDFEAVHGFSSGGKTGTSEYFDVTAGKMLTHAWYSGFAPYDNSEITVTVFLESGGGGADDAAPIARKIMDFYFKENLSQK